MVDDAAVNVSVAAVENQVLDLTASNSALYQSFTDFNGVTLDTDGIWIAGYFYYDGGTYPNGNAVTGLGDASAATPRMTNETGKSFIQHPGPVNTTELTSPSTAGWYFCVTHLRAAGGSTEDLRYFRNNETAELLGTAVDRDLTNIDNFGIGCAPDSSRSAYLGAEACGFAMGYGAPDDLVTWVYNSGGQLRDLSEYDFASDANGATLEHYWPCTRVDDSTAFSPTETAVQDTIGSLDTWSQDGTVGWANRPPPWESAGNIVIDSATIEDAARDELVVAISNSAGSDIGASPTVLFAETDFDIWTERGFGPIRVQSVSTVVTGDTAVVTMTLNRDIYASEDVKFLAAATWFDDGSADVGTQTGDVTNNSAAADPATATGISYGKIALGFDAAYAVGFYEDDFCAGYVVAA